MKLSWPSPPVRPLVLFAGLVLPVPLLAGQAPPSPFTLSPEDSSRTLTAGQVRLRVTNRGYLGHLGASAPNDPSGQWPGASGIEYLGSLGLAVGAVNPSQPGAPRVSFLREWGPASGGPVDRLYRSFEGQVNGLRHHDDDLDSPDVDPLDASRFLDEDFLDGRDNDGDGLVDEDYAAVGQEMFSLVMRDDGLLATSEDPAEPHRPLGLECRQLVWGHDVPGYRDFAVMEYTIINRSGHPLDDVTIAWRADLDAGPKGTTLYTRDDRDLPGVPSGEFAWALPADDPRRQEPHAEIPLIPADSALCPRLKLRLHGFSLADDSGDGCLETGVGTLLLLTHTIDPTGQRGPSRVGFRAYRSYTAGTPFSAGGEPGNDAERFAFMTSTEGIDPATGFINAAPGSQNGDYVSWCSVGPFPQVPDGGAIQVTIAFAVAASSFAAESGYASDYAAYRNGTLTDTQLFAGHPPLVNALNIVAAYEGNYASPPVELADERNINTTDFHGRETRLRAPEGFIQLGSDCHDYGAQRLITEFGYTWFDFDCDYCTGVWVFGAGPGGGTGLYLRHWDTTRPPIVAAGPDPPSAPVAMSLSLKPSTLNLQSQGRWVTAVLEPAAPFGAGDIAIASIRLNGTVPVDPAGPAAIGDRDGNGVADLTVRFDRGALDLVLVDGDAVPVSVTGLVDDQCFLGSTQIRVNSGAPAAWRVPAAESANPYGRFELSLQGVTPNPARRRLQIGFSLPDGSPATLALYDVGGRQVFRKEVGGLGPGDHVVALGAETSLPAGVYLVRLTQGRRSLTTRAAVIE